MMHSKRLRIPADCPMPEVHYFDSAQAIARLQTQGHARVEIARMTGLSIPRVMERLQLLGLDEGLQTYLRHAGAPERIALLLLRLPDEVSRFRMARRMVRERLCIRDAALLVEAAQRRHSAAKSAEHGQRVMTAVRDVRLYHNAVRDIAAQMNTAGVRATFTERRTGGMQELTVSYPARRRRVERFHSI